MAGLSAEAEVDKALVALSLLLPADESEPALRSRLNDLTAACANLCVEAETAVQLSMKNEALIVHQRNDLAESRATELALRKECLEAASASPDSTLLNSEKMLARTGQSGVSFSDDRLSMENDCLHAENQHLRQMLRILQEQLMASDLAYYCKEKEIVGRVQQVQLLTRDQEQHATRSSGSILDTDTWKQLEGELDLNRQKAMTDLLRRNVLAESGGMPSCVCKNDAVVKMPSVRQPRQVLLIRGRAGLGLSVAGGKDFGSLLYVAMIVPGSVVADSDLYIGDAILSANGIDVRGFRVREFYDLIEESDEVDLVVHFESHHCDTHHSSSTFPATAANTYHTVDDRSRTPATPLWAGSSSADGKTLPLGTFHSNPVQLMASVAMPLPTDVESNGVSEAHNDLFSV